MSHVEIASLVRQIIAETLTAAPARRCAPKLLTVEEAADAARAPVKSLREWIAAGRLRASRPGRRVLVRRVDLARFLGVDESDLEIG